MIENKVVKVLSYETPTLQETLSRYAQEGYKLVSTEMANNEHNIVAMYLFFVKETYDSLKKIN